MRGTEEHFELARTIDEEGTVLLRNDGLLPLDDSEIDELALIGWELKTFENSVGGSDDVTAIQDVGPVDGIKAIADVTVTTASPDGSEPLSPAEDFTYALRE